MGWHPQINLQHTSNNTTGQDSYTDPFIAAPGGDFFWVTSKMGPNVVQTLRKLNQYLVGKHKKVDFGYPMGVPIDPVGLENFGVGVAKNGQNRPKYASNTHTHIQTENETF